MSQQVLNQQAQKSAIPMANSDPAVEESKKLYLEQEAKALPKDYDKEKLFTEAMSAANENQSAGPPPQADSSGSTEGQEPKGPWDKFVKFINDWGILSTFSFASALNGVSAIARFAGAKEGTRKFLNDVSWGSTIAYQLCYGFTGIEAGFRKKNPILILAYSVEVLSLFAKVALLYLARGLATALDVIPASLKKLTGGMSFNSWSECLSKSAGAYSQMFKEFPDFMQKATKGFSKGETTWEKMKNGFGSVTDVLINDEDHVLAYSSITTSLFSIIGLTINNLVGAAGRNLSGLFSDFGVMFQKDKSLKIGGAGYTAGSIIDSAGWVFERILPKIFKSKAKRLEDIGLGFKEVAIASDRLGGFLLAKYNARQEEEGQGK